MNTPRAVVLISLLLLAGLSWSAEKAVCRVTYTTSAAGVTSLPLGMLADGGAADGGSTADKICNWPNGANVLVQCSSDVYANYAMDAGVLPDATSNDTTFAFATNLDPIPVCLVGQERHISVLGVSASGTCKFITTTLRRCPR